MSRNAENFGQWKRLNSACVPPLLSLILIADGCRRVSVQSLILIADGCRRVSVQQGGQHCELKEQL